MSALSELVNWYCPLRDFLYILQLEEYNIWRYSLQVRLRLWKRGFERRGHLKLTARLRLILGTTLALFGGWAVAVAIMPDPYNLLLVISVPAATPILIGLASLVVQPLAWLRTQRTLKKTHSYFAQNYPHTKIVAITGSYGKTTTKYLLHALLQYSFQTAIIPKNINTTLGIAQYLQQGLVSKSTEYLIVEMGAYVQGDIRECALMLPPDIAIITKLGDQHLERFGGFKRLVRAKNEIFAFAKDSAARFATEETVQILSDHRISASNIQSVIAPPGPKANQALAIAVARSLGVSDQFIADSLENFTSPERRDSVYQVDSVTVIDNSYNISPQTAQSIIANAAAIAKDERKKLVVMTAGISEQGTNSKQVNEDFAKLLNQHASRVILHPSIYRPAVQSKLTIPCEVQTLALTVLEELAQHIHGNTELLLHLPEHGDLAYL